MSKTINGICLATAFGLAVNYYYSVVDIDNSDDLEVKNLPNIDTESLNHDVEGLSNIVLPNYDVVSTDSMDNKDSYVDYESPDRLSLSDFLLHNQEFYNVDFSAFGKLLRNGFGACSAVLLEPGNLIATARHCIDDEDGGAEYHFVAYDNYGGASVVSLPVYGGDGTQYLHVSNSHDIAFFQLNSPLPDDIIPAKIAPHQSLRQVFTAGYSPEVRNVEGEDDSGLSISAKPCVQMDYVTAGNVISSCFADNGDSGGGSFVVNNSYIEITSIHSSSLMYVDEDGFRQSIDATNGVELSQMRGFCMETMGDEYCSGFPDPIVD